LCNPATFLPTYSTLLEPETNATSAEDKVDTRGTERDRARNQRLAVADMSPWANGRVDGKITG
jgi:hypothetical protein